MSVLLTYVDKVFILMYNNIVSIINISNRKESTMKLKRRCIMFICLLLIGTMLFVGCTSDLNDTDNNNVAADNGNSNDNKNSDKKEDQNKEKTVIDAFNGLKVTFSGISPRCSATIDNTGCSSDARSNVVFKTDKTFYADKDTVTVTATLAQQATESFTLKEETMTYTVSNVSSYYNANSVVVTDLIQNELRDVITAEISQMGQTNKLFGIGGYSKDWHYTKVDSVISTNAYLLTVKDTKIEEYGTNNAPFYNSLRIVADAIVHTGGNDGDRSGHFYICFILNDVVISPDGKISWKNSKNFEINYAAKANDNTVAAENVFSKSVYYNIQELEKTDWIVLNYTK